jgi:hypothetical protein
MQTPVPQRGWLLVPLGLAAGVAIGALTPASRQTPAPAPGSGLAENAAAPSDSEANAGAQATSRDDDLERELFPGAGSEDPAVQISPEKLLEIFDRVSNLKSEARKYVVAYRLVGQLGREQMEKAMELALVDWNENKDYSTTRAVARRWADLDPQGAVKKGAELKNYHVLQPALETWVKTDPSEPLKWALQQDGETQVAVVRQMLEFKSDFKGKQIERLVMAAADSPIEAMRNSIFPIATARLAEENPMAALHAAENAATAPARQQMVSAILSRMVKTQPDAAAQWLSGQANLAPAERQIYEKILKSASPKPAAPR